MECYHGVLSFSHSLQGSLTLNGKVLDFSGGRGYIEKDWGQSFPAAWVWCQSNHFANESACITASMAVIPWIGHAFRGFNCRPSAGWQNSIVFATYSGGRIESLQIFDDSCGLGAAKSSISPFSESLPGSGWLLRGPTRLDMGQRVLETLNATVQVRLETLEGHWFLKGLALILAGSDGRSASAVCRHDRLAFQAGWSRFQMPPA